MLSVHSSTSVKNVKHMALLFNELHSLDGLSLLLHFTRGTLYYITIDGMLGFNKSSKTVRQSSIALMLA